MQKLPNFMQNNAEMMQMQMQLPKTATNAIIDSNIPKHITFYMQTLNKIKLTPIYH